MSQDNVKDLRDRIIWSELNLARNSIFLFPPTKSVVLSVPRKIEIDAKNGVDSFASITIFPSAQHESPDQFCYDVLLGVLYLWVNEFNSEGNTVKTSFNGIAKAIGMNGCRNNINKIRNAILSLNYTKLYFNDSWREPDDTVRSTELHLSLISVFEAEYIDNHEKRFSNNHVTIQLPKQLLDSIEAGKTCGVSLTARRKIKSSVSRMIYSHVDRIIANTGKWTKNGDDLLELIGEHRPDVLARPSKKIRLLDSLVKDINGMHTTWGETIAVRQVESHTSELPKIEFSAIKPTKKTSNKFVSLVPNNKQTQQTIIFAFVDSFGWNAESITSNAGINKVVQYGDIETIRISISKVREDKTDFKDIKDLRGYFVDRFKKESAERKTQNPFFSS